MSDPTFSIVVPAYNTEADIGLSIRSVLKQTRNDFELIVVDDGSTDGTYEAASRFSGDERLRLVRQANAGPGSARNHGLRVATGRYIAFLDSDDAYLPRYLEVMHHTFAARPEAAAVSPLQWAFDDARRRILRPQRKLPDSSPLEGPAGLRRLLALNVVPARSTVRRDVVDAVGPLREDLLAAMDYEYWLRIVAKGYPIVRLNEPLVLYRLRAGSISTDHVRVYRNVAAVYRIVAEEYEVPEDVRAYARRKEATVQQQLDALLGNGPVARARRATRRAHVGIVRLKQRLLEDRIWYREPPPEVAEAFPELFVGQIEPQRR
jgi:glycosyltransferase involved in cell wall biosynthesis